MRYLPHTAEDQRAMLKALGLSSVDQLFDDIPPAARFQRSLELPPPLTEMELARHMTQLAGRNRPVTEFPCFLGGGFYDRYVPQAVTALIQRGEFLTAYTPYQPEVSQGTLAAIFEFQSMIQSLTGTYAAQASLYDGSSAVAEACLLAMAQLKGRQTVLLSRGLYPDHRRVAQTYLQARDAQIIEFDDGDQLRRALSADVAAVVVQYPDLWGRVTHVAPAIELAHQAGALAIVSADPVALAVLTPPGEMGADIVVGEGQPLGNALQYGGPTFGYFAVQENLVRKLPGRLVGATRERRGRRGFVLTLQAREQHIRRDKATSNICSNHSLNALAATIYLSLLGPEGLREVALRSAQLAHYLAERLQDLGCERVPSAREPFLYEFVVRVPAAYGSVAELNRFLLQRHILGGWDLGRWDPQHQGLWQLAVTERRTRAECDQLVEEVRAWMSR